MRGDNRQIQTAVLGGAESEKPLMLPLEAIELDAFRRRHVQHTFWCGLLLGGCGLQLTTKLYTDRVCHFAHYPGPDGHPHLCGRSARGVASADHLYVKAATDAWLRARGTQAGFDFVQPDGVPIGSVVDIQLPHRKLRVHLDQEVAPDWDAEHEPVLGASVPVDSDTLIDRWYVHRIRLESEGTARRVRIGTEAFARPTEWFALDECEITDRGLSTPAVERIVEARSAPPSTRWTPGKKQEESAQDVQAHELMRRVLYARRTVSTDLAEEVCREIAELAGVSPQLRRRLDAARRSALAWVEKETEARQELFARLSQAVAAQKTGSAKAVLAEIKAGTTRGGRTEEEEHTVREAAAYLAAVEAARLARLDTLLEDVSRLPANEDPWLLKSKVEQLLQGATGAGKLGEHRQAQLSLWSTRLRHLPFPPRPATPFRPQERVPLHEQVSRANWTTRPCPQCGVDRGQQCVVDGGPRAGRVRQVPHVDRLRPVVDELQEQQKKHGVVRTVWRAYDVPCPDCGQEAGAWCLTPGKPHSARSKRARQLSAQQEPRL
ncbi:zinc finger domain-containing protein [Streptomyces sp. MJM1172]|uniref:zinc finger domain-containing protein n=1 Tax=Streptomyces sp. MJM1172 TaxID=1703926 RepID=UPI000B0C506E|nr:hypothetical protein [Streptomyces sp. MJM1172]